MAKFSELIMNCFAWKVVTLGKNQGILCTKKEEGCTKTNNLKGHTLKFTPLWSISELAQGW